MVADVRAEIAANAASALNDWVIFLTEFLIRVAKLRVLFIEAGLLLK